MTSDYDIDPNKTSEKLAEELKQEIKENVPEEGEN